jgi:hypothetical protein
VVAVSNPVPTIEIGDDTSHGGGTSSSGPFSIGQDLGQLFADGGGVYRQSGSTNIDMDAGVLSLASPAQIGSVRDGVTCTAAMVEANQNLLDELGVYARLNGYTITVEADLDLSPAGDWNYQWEGPAAQANLPIGAVENDNEDALMYANVPGGYAQAATYEVNIVKELLQYFPNVHIGQWEAGAPISDTTAWLSTYDQAAAAAGLPGISYFVADVSWYAPWITAPAVWETALTNLSQLAASDGIGLDVLLGGSDYVGSDQAFTSEIEQEAAMLGSLGGVTVDILKIRTWAEALPDAVAPINEPTTLGNAAAEVAAIFPLYQSGDVTAAGVVTATVGPQRIVTATVAAALQNISLSWTAGDVATGARVAVVLIDETGQLSAQVSGTGSVSGSGTNELILNGTSADIAGELETLTITEPVSGVDIVDIEGFGSGGRDFDRQIAVVSVPTAAQTSGQEFFTFAQTSPSQQWTAASATINDVGIVTSTQLRWNSSDAGIATGSPIVIRSVSINEPLAQDLTLSGNKLEESLANPQSNTAASEALDCTSYNPLAFYAPGQFATVSVLETDNYYDQTNGALLSTVARLAPSTPTTLLPGPGLSNYFSTGGTQITEYNTGNNPGWQSNWLSSLSSVTTTCGSNGEMLEQTFTGGASDPWLVLVNVFNPYTGALWEQFQTLPPPSPYQNGVYGVQLVTQFNTGDNPNWDYTDWGNNAQVTTTWQDDYICTDVSSTAPVPVGLLNTDAYAATQNGSILIGANGSSTIYGTKGDTIYAGLGTTFIFTSSGGSNIYLPYYGSSNVTLTSGGGDSVYVGVSNLLITDTGSVADTVYAQGNGFTVGSGSSVIVPWDHSIVNIASSTTLVVSGNYDTVVATGSNDTLTLSGTNGVGHVGAGVKATLWGSNNTLTAGDGASGSLDGQGNKLTAGTASAIAVGGNGDTVNLGAGSTVWEVGISSSATLQSNGSICEAGSSELGFGGAGSYGWVSGTDDQLTEGDRSLINIVGNYDTATVGNASQITATGNHDTLNLYGNNDVGTASANSTINLTGNGSTGTVGDNSTITATGSNDTLNLSGTNDLGTASGSTINLIGSWSTATVGNMSKIIATGSNDTLNLSGNQDVGTAGINSFINLTGNNDRAAGGSGSKIIATGNTDVCTAGANSTISLTGNFDIGTIGDNSTIVAKGSNDTLNLSGNHDIGAAVNKATINVIGNYDTAAVGDWSKIIATGNNETLNLQGNNDVGRASANSTINLTGNGSTGTIGDNSTIIATGSNDTLNLSGTNDLSTASNSTINLIGSWSTATVGNMSKIIATGSNDTLNLSGNQDVGTAGINSFINLTGNNDRATGGSGSKIIATGNTDVCTAGANSTVNLSGNFGIGTIGDSSTIAATGSNDTLNLSGNHDIGTAVSKATVNVIGNYDTVTVGDHDTVTLGGTNDTLWMGDAAIAFITGTDETIAIKSTGGNQTISGFSLSQRDHFDLSQILAGVGLKDDLSNLSKFVAVSSIAQDTILTISGASGTDTMTLHGVGALSLAQFVANASLVMPLH